MASRGTMRPRRRRERFQDERLAPGQIEDIVVDAGLAVGEVEGEPAAPDDLGLQVRGAAQQRAQPRQQFFEREGLGQVIVRPVVEAGDPVGDLASNRQHEYGHPVPAGAQLRDQGQSVAVRQLPVEGR